VVAHTLNIDLELVSIKPSNTLTAPNGMASIASITSEACAYVSIEMCINPLPYTAARETTELVRSVNTQPPVRGSEPSMSCF
jgi:hypothetical protein